MFAIMFICMFNVRITISMQHANNNNSRFYSSSICKYAIFLNFTQQNNLIKILELFDETIQVISILIILKIKNAINLSECSASK